MRISIHQSHYLPWLRYLDKIDRSDAFVLLDDAQFNRNGYQNRNRVKGPEGPVMLTVPVLQEYQQSMLDVRCNPSVRWQRKHWLTIEQHYRKAPFFQAYAPELRAFYERPWERLADLNAAMLTWYLEKLQIQTRVVCSKDLHVTDMSTARLIAICQALGADEYLSGAHAIGAYLDPEQFERAGIQLLSQSWNSPVYEQVYPAAGYAPDLSIVDLLLTHGPDSLTILRSGGAVEAAGFIHHG